MQPHQLRVVTEKAELDVKLGALRSFMRSAAFPTLPQAEQDLLERQAIHMTAYSDALAERISLWTEGFKSERAEFFRGDLVRKRSGSHWEGRVVGWYSTTLTPEGYAVESLYHPGSVQIYPAAALELVARSKTPNVGGEAGTTGARSYRSE